MSRSRVGNTGSTYSPKESSLKNSSSGSYWLSVSLYLVLLVSIFDPPTTCGLIVGVEVVVVVVVGVFSAAKSLT